MMKATTATRAEAPGVVIPYASTSRAARSKSPSRNGFASQRQPLSSRKRSASVPTTSPVTKISRAGQRRRRGGNRAVERHAVHARHLQIADHQVVGALGHSRERLFAIPGPVHDETRIGQRVADGRRQRRLVFDDQHASARQLLQFLGRRRRARRLPQRAAGDRQLHEERRAAPGRRLDANAPAVLLDDRVRDGQSEPGALADVLGREERVEDLGLHVVGHSRARRR